MDFMNILQQSANRFEIPEIKPFSSHFDYLKWQCENYNSQKGELQGLDCTKCKNRGYFYKISDDTIVQTECSCLITRKSLLRLKKSGLEPLAEKFTFENYKTVDEWQLKAKEMAIKYTKENTGKWLFFGGQSGCGKTHLCTAVSVNLMNRGHDLMYILWRDFVRFIEQNRFKEESYSEKMHEIQQVDILYIDDFLKTTHKTAKGLQPSDNELNIAYELINDRINSGKRTIISSEMHISDIVQLDEATGGRISEKSWGYQIQIKHDSKRNFRLGGGLI